MVILKGQLKVLFILYLEKKEILIII